MKIDWKSFKEKYIKPNGIQFPVGSIVFKGFQGSGKTLSMVHYVFDLQKQFPKCIIYSNVKIKGLKNFHLIEKDRDVAEAISAQNGQNGVVLLLDEAHLFFNKKTGISLDVLTAISQQRKDRRRIVMSSQIWEELDISLRKQVKHIVSCRCRFGCLQYNTISDGESLTYDKLQCCYTAKTLYTEVFKHNQKLYDSYDTFQKIVRNNKYSRTPTSPPKPSSCRRRPPLALKAYYAQNSLSSPLNRSRRLRPPPASSHPASIASKRSPADALLTRFCCFFIISLALSLVIRAFLC